MGTRTSVAKVAHKTDSAEVSDVRASEVFSMMAEAFAAIRCAGQERMGKVATVAVKRDGRADLGQFLNTMQCVEAPAVGARIVGEVTSFSLAASVLGVMPDVAFFAQKRSVAKTNVLKTFAVLTFTGCEEVDS